LLAASRRTTAVAMTGIAARRRIMQCLWIFEILTSTKNCALGSEAHEVGLPVAVFEGLPLLAKRAIMSNLSLKSPLVTPKSETRSEISVKFGIYKVKVNFFVSAV